MKSPVKEGAPSPIRSVPQSPHSPAHREPPQRGAKSPGKAAQSPAPAPQPGKDGKEDGDYDDDFEAATQENVSSLEEDRHREGIDR